MKEESEMKNFSAANRKMKFYRAVPRERQAVARTTVRQLSLTVELRCAKQIATGNICKTYDPSGRNDDMI